MVEDALVGAELRDRDLRRLVRDISETSHGYQLKLQGRTIERAYKSELVEIWQNLPEADRLPAILLDGLGRDGRAVVRLNQREGVPLHRYNSITAASKAHRVSCSRMRQVLETSETINGYYFGLAKEEEEEEEGVVV
jgi:hypothetical protein